VSYILVTSHRAPRCGPPNCPTPLENSQGLFELFHRFPASKVVRMRCRRLIPNFMVRLGNLKGLIYSSDRARPGCPRTYIHFMQTPVQLTCDPRGSQLYIVGGNYRVTERGIEG
jgi:hypothetical protein